MDRFRAEDLSCYTNTLLTKIHHAHAVAVAQLL